MEEQLSGLREQISKLDKQLVRLLNERAEIALKMGKLKTRRGVRAYDPEHERLVLEHITELNEGPLGKGGMEDIYADILMVCRELQSR